MKKLMLAVVAACAAVGAFAETTADYVQTGLIACWDGYENIGIAGRHALALTEWKDTSGTYSFVFNANSGIAVDGSALAFSGANGCYAKLGADATAATFEAAKTGTVEIVILSDPTTAQKVALQSSAASGIAFGALSRSSADANASLVTSNNNRPLAPYNWSSEITTFAVTYSEGQSQAVWANAEAVSLTGQNYFGGPGTETFLGFRANLSSGQAFQGRIYAIRLYATQLTEEQIAANHAVDVKRFVEGDIYGEGVYSEGFPQDFAIGNLPAYGYVEKSVGETVELTAPEMVEVSENERAYCAGWKLYDCRKGWLVAESTEENKTRCAFEYEKPVRLVWQWRMRYYVTASAEEGLSATASSDWAWAGEEVTFTATDGAKTFAKWTGDVPGEFATKSAFTLAVTSPMALHAAAAGATATISAADDFAAAVNALRASATAENPAVLYLRPGVYTAASGGRTGASHLFIVDAPIHLVGLGEKPTDVLLDGEGTYRVLKLTDPNASAEHLAVYRPKHCSGSVLTGYGIHVENGVVTDCVVTNAAIATSANTTEQALFVSNALAAAMLVTDIKDPNDDTTPYPRAGRGVYLWDAILRDSTVTGVKTGCATLYGRGDSTRIERCLIAGNVCRGLSNSGQDGCAGAYLEYGAKMTDSSIINNSTTSGGGDHNYTYSALILYGPNGNPATVDRCVITNNTGCGCCPAAVLLNNASYLRNSLVADNHLIGTLTRAVGAVNAANSSWGPKPQIHNCTIAGNTTARVGYPAGITMNYGIMANCIVADNGSDPASEVAFTGSTVTCSRLPVEVAGDGNTTDAPIFQNAAKGDYSLQLASTLVDAGIACTEGAVDLCGVTRPQGAGYDLGAYEYVFAGGGECDVKLTGLVEGPVPFALAAEAVVIGGAATAYKWTVTAGDAAPVVITDQGATLAYTVTTPGRVTVALETTFADGSKFTATKPDLAYAGPHEVFASTYGGNVWPYDTAAKAAWNVNDAIAACGATAENPGICHLMEGTYTAENGYSEDAPHIFVLDRPVILRGDNRDFVTLDGENTRRIIRIENENAALENVTLTRGADLVGSTAGYGFALHLVKGTVSNCTVSASYIVNLSPVYASGGLIVDTRVTGTTVKNLNKSPLVSLAGRARMRNCQVVDNTCSRGAVAADGANVLIEKTVVQGNTQAGYNYMYDWACPGVRLANGATIVESLVCSNTVSGQNGDLTCCAGIRALQGTIDRCVIKDNKGNINNCYGCGAWLAGSSVIRNSLVTGNAAKDSSNNYAGGIYLAGGSVQNCTVVGNTTASGSGADGIYRTSGTVVNTIVSGNGSNPARQISAAAGVTYTCVNGADIAGEGNRNCDPGFKNAAEGDYSLQLSSLLRDAGTPIAAVTNDLVGTERPQGDGYDIGAYEYSFAGGAECDIKVTGPTEGPVPFALEAEAVVIGGVGVEYKWTVTAGDAAPVVITDQGATLAYEVTTPGKVTITLEVVCEGGGTASVTKPDLVYAGPHDVFVATDGEDIWPYDTAAKAARNINDAIAACGASAENPGICHLAAGTYTAANGYDESRTHIVVIDRPVILRGDSRDAVILDGENARRIVSVENAKAGLESVTLARGTDLVGGDLPYGQSLHLVAGTVSNCVVSADCIVKNSSVYASGGVLADTQVTGTTYAAIKVAPVVTLGGTVRMTNCRVADNTCSRGAIVADGAKVLMEKLVVQGNVQPGSAYMYEWACPGVRLLGGATIVDSLVCSNSFSGSCSDTTCCAGIRAQQGTIDRCVIKDNKGNITRCYGCGVWLAGTSVIRNSLVVGNVAQANAENYAGGIYNQGGSVQNCTVVGNTTGNAAGADGIYRASGTVVNTIVSGNGSDPTRQISAAGGVTYTCVNGADIAGEGNRNCDPLFKNAAEGDYSLQLSSLLRDAGTAIAAVTNDLAGVERPQGDGYDIGAYEYPFTGGPECDIGVIGSAEGPVPFALQAQAIVVGGVGVGYTWTVTAGDAEPVVITDQGATLAYTVTAPGRVTVSLEVTCEGGGTASVTKPNLVYAGPHEVFVATDGANVWPYDTAAKAARNINDAIAACGATAANPGVVNLAAGTYTAANCFDESKTHLVIVDKPVVLRGAAKETTFIDGAKERRIIQVAHERATVENLTFWRGADLTGGVMPYGPSLQVSAGLVTNCAVSAAYIVNNAPVYATGGVIADSIVTGTTYKALSLAPVVSLNANARMVNCRVANNACSRGAVVADGANVRLEGMLVQSNTQTAQNYMYEGVCPGVRLENGAKIVDSVVRSNVINGNAGDISCCPGIRSRNGTIERCIVRDNTGNISVCRGCGVWLAGGSTIRNSLVAGNVASVQSSNNAGGIYVENGNVQNCTVVSNVTGCTTGADGIYRANGTVVNTIVSGNGTDPARQIIASAGVTYTCVNGADIAGEGNINKDPQLRAFGRKIYRLKPSSPCVGKGDPSLWTADDVDLLGNPRLTKGKVDMGCYELIVPGLMLMVK